MRSSNFGFVSSIVDVSNVSSPLQERERERERLEQEKEKEREREQVPNGVHKVGPNLVINEMEV